MPGRILTLQRQARELGRLRTGYTTTDGGKLRTHKSDTWIITSPAEHYVAAAAAEWGGKTEAWQPQGNGASQFRVITKARSIDAILPPGDPLSQSYELWNRGGCVRRCDGQIELRSDNPCLCRAQFGDDFHRQKAGTVCKPTTRLNVILPSMPDIGVWRMETHGYWAANEIAAHIDLIRAATAGQSAVPIRLRIEPRTKVEDGKTSQYQVVIVELRGGIKAGHLLGGPQALAAAIDQANRNDPTALAVNGGPERRAIEGAVATDWMALITGATTREELLEIRAQAAQAGLDPEATDRALAARAAQLGLTGNRQPIPGAALATAAPEQDAADEVWQEIVAASPFDETADLEKDLAVFLGVTSDEATSEQLRKYLEHLKNGGA